MFGGAFTSLVPQPHFQNPPIKLRFFPFARRDGMPRRMNIAAFASSESATLEVLYRLFVFLCRSLSFKRT